MQKARIPLLPLANDGKEFKTFVLQDGTVGVYDHQRSKQNNAPYGWIDGLISIRLRGPIHFIQLNPPPPLAYNEYTANIGGFGLHVRYNINLVRTNSNVALIVTHIQDPDHFRSVIWPKISKFCAPSDLAMAPCRFHLRTTILVKEHVLQIMAFLNESNFGAIPEQKRDSSNAKLGFERLDRSDQLWPGDILGPSKNVNRWTYAFIPSHWEVPFKWQTLAKNVYADITLPQLEHLPRPLQFYVMEHAKSRLATLQRELLRGLQTGREKARRYIQSCVQPWLQLLVYIDRAPHVELRRCHDRVCSALNVHEWWQATERVTHAILGKLHASKQQMLRMHSHKCATARLSGEQNRQLLNCFYHASIAPFEKTRVQLANALSQVYLCHTGTIGREIGSYVQSALHVGEGETVRNMKNKPQYLTQNLSVGVLNKIYTLDGHMQGRGSKRRTHAKDASRRLTSRKAFDGMKVAAVACFDQ